MNDQQPELAQGLTELMQDMQRMTDTAVVVGKRLDDHQSMIKRSMDRHRRALAIVIFGLILDLSLTVFGGVLYVNERNNARQLSDVQQRTSRTVLCPLYNVFIQSIKVNPAPANSTPEYIKMRSDAAKVIQDGYNSMGCTP
jgi:hypothetical protein